MSLLIFDSIVSSINFKFENDSLPKCETEEAIDNCDFLKLLLI